MEEIGLARFINTPTGLKPGEAANLASLHLELLRGKGIAQIDDALDSLDGYLRLLGGRTPPPAVEQELQRLTYAIIEVAETFGYQSLGKSAYSLFELLDNIGVSGQWDRDAVIVHMESLRLLRHPEAVPPEMQTHLLDRLRLVVARHRTGSSK